ncbi:YbbR-like domain-containing protein [Paenibacillaceae bacterium WGS1546]|uniref:CdaR family protein n=1 Tax=Cohnella sp. WGS1546 TaxID=3366810 RepID=UPI00372D3674
MDKWLDHPTAAKLVALALGILMWAVVHFDPDDASSNNVAPLFETKVIEGVTVQPYGLDERNYVLIGMEPLKVNLTVRGTRSDLRAAQTKDYRIRVDLRTVGEGQHTLPLEENLPRGITAVTTTPSSAIVSIEALQTREYEVEIATTGAPAKGYKVGTPIVKPNNRVHVTLPKSQLSEVVRVGATLAIDGEKETIKSKSVKLAAYDKDGKPIEGAAIDPAVLEVEIPITHPFKIVPLQFKLTGQMPSGLGIASFKPDVEQVTVYGPQDALDRLELIDVEVPVGDVRNSGKVTVPLKVEPPIIEISPAAIDIQIEVLLSTTRKLEGLPITLSGLGEGLEAVIVDPESGKADITIQGAPQILDRLRPGDVDVIADLSGRGPGVYTIPLVVSLERFMEQVGGTSSITVEITDPNAEETIADGEEPPPGDPEGGAGGGTGGTDGSDEGGGGATESPQPPQP